jgi:hypothetical protein
VHLDQGGHAERLDPLQQSDEGVLLQRRHDQQHQVGAVRPRLVHLVAGDHEVLAQDRDLHRGADGGQVVERPAEPTPLGEHADGPGTTGGVVAGQVGRVGDLGELSTGRGGTLHLRDHRHAGAAQGRVRVQRRRRGGGQLADPLQRNLLLSPGHVLAHAGQDLVEHAADAGPVRPPRAHAQQSPTDSPGVMGRCYARRQVPGYGTSRDGLGHNARLR